MKTLLITLILLAALAGCDFADGDTVQVCDPNSCGTAFYVGDGLWLTTSHIFDPNAWKSKDRYIKHPDYGFLDIEFVSLDFKTDIAVFEIVSPGEFEFEKWTFCPRVPLMGAITALSETPFYDQAMGRIVPIKGVDPVITSPMVYMDMTIYHGFSGGPVVYNRTGCVIGMTRGMLPKSGNSYAIYYKALQKELP